MDFYARQYDPQLGRFNNVDPLADKYYSLSPFANVANNPVRYIDPDGRRIVDPNGNRVIITYNKDGSLSFSKNASKDIIRMANALNLTSTGRAQLKKIDNSDINVKLNISSNALITKNSDGTTSYQSGAVI